MRRRGISRLGPLAALGLSVLGTRAFDAASAGGPPPAGPAALSSVDQLRAPFNDDAGTPRLVLLLAVGALSREDAGWGQGGEEGPCLIGDRSIDSSTS